MTTPQQAIDFLLIAGRCKLEKRTGWINHNVPLPESVADHMYRMAVACLLLPTSSSSSFSTTTPSSSSLSLPSSSPPSSPSFDITRAALIALAHDIGEAITTDIVPHDPMGRKEKQRREQAAMMTIRDIFQNKHSPTNTSVTPTTTTTTTTTPESYTSSGRTQKEGPPASCTGTLLYELWQEYETQSSPEARAVKDLDKLEMILQALEYEKMHPHIHLEPFFTSVRDKYVFKTSGVSEWAKEVYERRTRQRQQQQEQQQQQRTPYIAVTSPFTSNISSDKTALIFGAGGLALILASFFV